MIFFLLARRYSWYFSKSRMTWTAQLGQSTSNLKFELVTSLEKKYVNVCHDHIMNWVSLNTDVSAQSPAQSHEFH